MRWNEGGRRWWRDDAGLYTRWARVASIAAAALVASHGAARAQSDDQADSDEVRVNYVYAAQLGFGTYDVGGLRAHAYSLPIGFTEEDVVGSWDLRIRLPIIYGLYKFEGGFESDGSSISIRAETNTIAFEPMLLLDIPLFEGFRVTPLAAWGFGTSFGSSGNVRIDGAKQHVSGSDNAFYTYQIGVTSLYERPWNDFTFSLGNAFIYAGDASIGDEDETVEGYGTYRAGVAARHPLGFEIATIEPDAGVYFVYNYFTPSLQFTRFRQATLAVDHLYEIGATIGSASPLDLPLLGRALEGMRIGASYDVAEGLDGFRLTLGFPF